MATIELRGGLFVNVDALLLSLALEDRGHAMTVKDGALMVSNGAALTVDDRAVIKAQKAHLMAIADYKAPA